MPVDNNVPATSSTVGIGAVAITRHLPVKLDNARKLELLDELAEHNREFNRLEAHKKQMADATAKAMKHRKGEMDKISDTVAQGMELKPVACRKEIDYLHGRVSVFRIDTGEILEEKALDEEDMKQ